MTLTQTKQILKTVSSLLIFSGVLSVLFPLVTGFQTVRAVEGSYFAPYFTVDKATALPGETLTYTLRVVNDGSTDLTSVFTYEPSISNYINYKPGSTFKTKGTVTVNESDDWLADGLNMGSLVPSQEVSVVFQAEVKDGVPNSAFIETTLQINAIELPEWIQCAAVTRARVEGEPSLSIDKKVKGDGSGGSPQAWQDAISKLAPHGYVFGSGETVFYLIEIENSGTDVANDVRIEDVLPAYIRVGQNTTVVITVGDLAEGEKKSFEYEAQVIASVPSGEHEQINVAKVYIGDEEEARDETSVWIRGGDVLAEVPGVPAVLPISGVWQSELWFAIIGLGMTVVGTLLRCLDPLGSLGVKRRNI
ncbi:DUF11 domain-containing protein [Candidatus Parcubacteria bacterium]|nr:DUF11 domain-containing protein [Candidatus Parcubacteria bacterium]